MVEKVIKAVEAKIDNDNKPARKNSAPKETKPVQRKNSDAKKIEIVEKILSRRGSEDKKVDKAPEAPKVVKVNVHTDVKVKHETEEKTPEKKVVIKVKASSRGSSANSSKASSKSNSAASSKASTRRNSVSEPTATPAPVQPTQAPV